MLFVLHYKRKSQLVNIEFVQNRTTMSLFELPWYVSIMYWPLLQILSWTYGIISDLGAIQFFFYIDEVEIIFYKK